MYMNYAYCHRFVVKKMIEAIKVAALLLYIYFQFIFDPAPTGTLNPHASNVSISNLRSKYPIVNA